MIELLEITVWDCNQENHTYFVSDNKQFLHAYRAFGSTEIITFKKPMKFNTSKRKFKVIK